MNISNYIKCCHNTNSLFRQLWQSLIFTNLPKPEAQGLQLFMLSVKGSSPFKRPFHLPPSIPLMYARIAGSLLLLWRWHVDVAGCGGEEMVQRWRCSDRVLCLIYELEAEERHSSLRLCRLSSLLARMSTYCSLDNSISYADIWNMSNWYGR